MRHIQLYESFATDSHKVAAYKNYEEWMEFMGSVLTEDYFRMFNNIDYERMWRDRSAYQSPSYVVDNTWIFWLDSPKYTENPTKVVALQINDRRTITDSNQSRMETTLGCSYKDLLAIAKTPEEVMADEMAEDFSLIDTYSQRRPRVFKRVLAMPDLPKELKAALKWKEMKNYI
jgi:hypothetical protein